jgi:hypothetical protein
MRLAASEKEENRRKGMHADRNCPGLPRFPEVDEIGVEATQISTVHPDGSF